MEGQNIHVHKAVILASGYGRRMRHKTGSPSKPMTLIGEKPLISYGIDLLIWSGIQKIYIVYHSVTADVLTLRNDSRHYAKYLEFIREDEQKGTLLSFSRVKDIIEPPFLMTFEDIIAKKSDFIEMLSVGKKYVASEADLVIQTVRAPSLLSEQAFLTESNRVIRYQKDGIIGKIHPTQEKKYGGMVCLWLRDPFPLVERYLSRQSYKISTFLEDFVLHYRVFEMPIHDMWDVDTPEVAELTKEILEKQGGWHGCFE